MPSLPLRYFTVAGGALLALLFVVSTYWPEAETINHGDALASPSFESCQIGWVRRGWNFDTRVQASVVPTSAPAILEQVPTRDAETSFTHCL